ncbi:MAG: universal stress protein [Candidatus Eremiobacteraeota bacterium]|nr:universal stress protein [Candidatus Eremiobacteraeota bacterium]MBV8356270.1 universal stress protein [Candidatus Eremiobacteraeota bacterium]
MIAVHPAGAAIGLGIVFATTGTLWWMVHPPSSRAEERARIAERALKHMVGSIIVVFSPEIRSEHMMVLAARLARRDRAELLVTYAVDVPFTLPLNASMENEDRAALDVLAAAEVIAQKQGVHIRTEIIHGRQTSQAVLDLAKREKAHLIVMGSYREGKYSGAPLGRAIEQIAAGAKCDVLIGVEGQHGTLLQSEPEATSSKESRKVPS